MIPLNLSELAKVLNAKHIGDDISVSKVSSDSRVVDAQTLFVALKGERFDAHDFAAKAVMDGACALLVERELPIAVPQLIVPNSQKAMGQIGAHVKQCVAPKSVALTGSNGKTSVKEMVATILSTQHQVLYTAGNFNNEVGVPLTLLRLEPQHEYGVFELGANHLGEINYTSSLVQPDVAMVNNVASAHLEGFGSLEGVAKAKSEIFLHLAKDGIAVINADDAFADVMRRAAGNHAQLSFSSQGNPADVSADELSADALGCYRFRIAYEDEQRTVSLPLSGRHQVSNALAATSICLALGLSLDEIVQGLMRLQPVKGRMQPTRLGRFLLIDDTYNANPASVGAAIDWLQEIEGNRCLVLGDLGELGDNASLLHRQLGEKAKQQGIDALYSLGELSRASSEAFAGKHFTDLDALVVDLVSYFNQLTGKVTVLVKGSRSAKMERVVEALIAAFERKELF
ncbi:UDP-N-acetylmuramoyl-tripeptide--D-alanyl-D-alanine ligase [Shewanella insulae]|uniref:UDP-N-acetylmuramoyl-tripeptide--D-alanyl-D- alanine ligase n=1 Tax=Shewanella insulae TaxID=2681496 RepID=UPI001EFE3E52|nr:UDP-N-acetylmuramoyl-tripeptide--D-alanyl-D-alanine ligase [Shewanella insulae]MCG9713773.1 UDP-N-acetylmuramoyl-tripeptide--D-alanyl-D-alanine ligase [Shewanella insulae]MCG9738732.1 UDP-N-acetylmuramoyl-tripeptide--D-alanyl-D-alanine ligase [Shewanella insulae]